MDIEKYISLKDKQRRGRLNADEQEALQRWSQSAEGKLWQQVDRWSESYSSGYEPDVEAGLVRLKARMQQAKTSTPAVQPLRVASRRTWVAVAAAVVVLVVAMVALRGLFRSAPEMLAVTTTANEQKKLTLTDGTQVQLNADSKLELPSSFENLKIRKVNLSGEAYFKVAQYEAQPFQIDAQAVTVTVVGTAFNMRAYPQEATIEVEVEKGIVRMAVGKESILLAAHEKGIYNSRENKLSKKSASQLNAQAWRTDRLQFNKAPLSEVIQALARYHRVQIDLANDAMKDCAYTCNFKKTKLEDVLKTLQLSLNVQWEKASSDHYILRGGACQ